MKSNDRDPDAIVKTILGSTLPESSSLDYKRDLPGSDRANRKFAELVASFANSKGGTVVFGVEEQQGLPAQVPGLNANLDEEILGLQSTLASRITPRIEQVSILPAEWNGKSFILVQVVDSSNKPHLVGTSGFPERGSAGLTWMDVEQVRRAFLARSHGEEASRNFCLERIDDVKCGELLAGDLLGTGRVILHVVSLEAITSRDHVDMDRISSWNNKLSPMGHPPASIQWNSLGPYVAIDRARRDSDAYVQVFRQGAIESVNANWIEGAMAKQIPSSNFAEGIAKSLPMYASILDHLGAPGPYYVSLSMVGVKGLSMAMGRPPRYDERNEFDVDEFHVPLGLYGSQETTTFLRRAFDSVFQAAGLPRSNYYDRDGAFKGWYLGGASAR